MTQALDQTFRVGQASSSKGWELVVVNDDLATAAALSLLSVVLLGWSVTTGSLALGLVLVAHVDASLEAEELSTITSAGSLGISLLVDLSSLLLRVIVLLVLDVLGIKFLDLTSLLLLKETLGFGLLGCEVVIKGEADLFETSSSFGSSRFGLRSSFLSSTASASPSGLSLPQLPLPWPPFLSPR